MSDKDVVPPSKLSKGNGSDQIGIVTLSYFFPCLKQSQHSICIPGDPMAQTNALAKQTAPPDIGCSAFSRCHVQLCTRRVLGLKAKERYDSGGAVAPLHEPIMPRRVCKVVGIEHNLRWKVSTVQLSCYDMLAAFIFELLNLPTCTLIPIYRRV